MSVPIPGRANGAMYAQVVRELLPRGPVWRGLGILGTIEGMAEELARMHNRSLDLLEEADPSTTTECIDDWERLLELPDCDTATPSTIEGRRAAVVGKLCGRRGQSPEHYAILGEIYGYAVTVRGRWRDLFRYGISAFDDPLWGRLSRADLVITAADAGALVDHDVFECAFGQMARGHVTLVFEYV